MLLVHDRTHGEDGGDMMKGLGTDPSLVDRLTCP